MRLMGGHCVAYRAFRSERAVQQCVIVSLWLSAGSVAFDSTHRSAVRDNGTTDVPYAGRFTWRVRSRRRSVLRRRGICSGFTCARRFGRGALVRPPKWRSDLNRFVLRRVAIGSASPE
jgi:hypothetical protein